MTQKQADRDREAVLRRGHELAQFGREEIVSLVLEPLENNGLLAHEQAQRFSKYLLSDRSGMRFSGQNGLFFYVNLEDADYAKAARELRNILAGHGTRKKPGRREIRAKLRGDLKAIRVLLQDRLEARWDQIKRTLTLDDWCEEVEAAVCWNLIQQGDLRHVTLSLFKARREWGPIQRKYDQTRTRDRDSYVRITWEMNELAKDAIRAVAAGYHNRRVKRECLKEQRRPRKAELRINDLTPPPRFRGPDSCANIILAEMLGYHPKTLSKSLA